MDTICVIGLGKMGTPIAAFYAARGYHVIGVDIDATVVATINNGRSPVGNEPEVAAMIQASVITGNLTATTDTVAAVRTADVVIVLVPLLIDPRRGYAPAYGMLERAMAAIGAGLRQGTLVVIETTVPVGDTRNHLGPLIEQASGMQAGTDFSLAFSPERVQSNHVLRNLREYPKIVGGVNAASTTAAVRFYHEALTDAVIAVDNCETAEFAKIAECIYRDVNIALANELAICAGEVGVDLTQVIAAANSEPLSHIHQPGLGVGGHCIPVYPYFMINRLGATRLASAARQINDGMADYAVQILHEAIGPLVGHPILILGLAYRADVKEAIFSSSLLLINALRAAGADVIVHDPLFTASEISRYGVTAAPGDLDEIPPMTAIIVQAWHTAFQKLDWRIFKGDPFVLDGRGALDPVAITDAGLRYGAIGRARNLLVPPDTVSALQQEESRGAVRASR